MFGEALGLNAANTSQRASQLLMLTKGRQKMIPVCRIKIARARKAYIDIINKRKSAVKWNDIDGFITAV